MCELDTVYFYIVNLTIIYLPTLFKITNEIMYYNCIVLIFSLQ